MAQNFSKVWVYVNFELNRHYIANSLCVNKADVKACCRGKCQLKKALNHTEDNTSLPGKRSHNEESISFFTEIKSVAFNPGGFLLDLFFNTSTLYTFQSIRCFYHPPQL